MAISDNQKLDYLFKKLGYGATKTDTVAKKLAANESIASPLLIRGDTIWAASGLIPSVKPASSSGVVTVQTAIESTEDITATGNRTWKTGITDWIPTEFGSTYLVNVYVHTSGDAAGAESMANKVFTTGSGNNDEWFFDYQSGVLNFIGDNLPTAIGTGTSNVLYAAGAKYVGTFGVTTDVGSTANTFVGVATLSSLFSRTDVNAGDIIEISDGGDGEYAIYMAKQDSPTTTSHLTLVSTRDGGSSDAATLTADVTYNTGAVTLGDVSAGSKPISVVINVTAPFDGTTEITVGDGDNNSRLMSSAYVDLSETGTFVTNPSYVYSNSVDAQNTLRVYVTAGDSTQGNATILVSYA